MKRRPLLLLLPLSVASLLSCQKAAAPAGANTPPSVPVSVATATRADVPVILRTIGSVEAKAFVILRPQIAGRVIDLPVQEGRDVNKGDLLVSLDPRPHEAALAEAQANVTRNIAMADDAHRLAERTGNPAVSAAISQRETESARAKAAAADAEILASKAQVESAKLNLLYCTITAPFSGRLGSFKVKPGSIVKENETDLVELAQVDPIEVAFALPEENLPALRAAMGVAELHVEASPSGDNDPPASGTLTFIDNRVDPATGTIRLKATFENTARRLWPGQFTNVRLLLGHDQGVVTVPESAVQTTQGGAAIFVVKPDQTVELRQVAVRRVAAGRSIIERGIAEGETVVTEGQLRLGPGSKVQVKAQQATVPTSPPSPS